MRIVHPAGLRRARAFHPPRDVVRHRDVIGPARKDARRRGRISRIERVGPEPVVGIFHRPSAIAGNEGAIERVAAEKVVHNVKRPVTIARRTREIMGKREHDRAVEQDRVRAPGVVAGERHRVTRALFVGEKAIRRGSNRRAQPLRFRLIERARGQCQRDGSKRRH